MPYSPRPRQLLALIEDRITRMTETVAAIMIMNELEMKDNNSDSNSGGNKKKKLIKNHIIYQLANNSLFCVCCWTAESSPALERTADAAVGLGCC